MKNVHIIPTDKPSRLYSKDSNHKLDNSTMAMDWYISSVGYKPQNIYITSSNEEIKANVYALINKVLCKTELLEGIIVSRQLVGGATMDICKSEYLKIILTTDQDLIKDGVQTIDDEFLEWFVKNPSCEEVDLDTFSLGNKILFNVVFPKEELNMIECYFTPRKDTSSATICSNCGQEKFLHTIGEGIKISTYIVNAKEEPKQHLIDMMKRDEELGLYEEPKQETLEELAESFFNKRAKEEGFENWTQIIVQQEWEFIELFPIEFAKWQAERMYSEEEVKQIIDAALIEYSDFVLADIPNWFEQFKKK